MTTLKRKFKQRKNEKRKLQSKSKNFTFSYQNVIELKIWTHKKKKKIVDYPKKFVKTLSQSWRKVEIFFVEMKGKSTSTKVWAYEKEEKTNNVICALDMRQVHYTTWHLTLSTTQFVRLVVFFLSPIWHNPIPWYMRSCNSLLCSVQVILHDLDDAAA